MRRGFLLVNEGGLRFKKGNGRGIGIGKMRTHAMTTDLRGSIRDQAAGRCLGRVLGQCSGEERAFDNQVQQVVYFALKRFNALI